MAANQRIDVHQHVIPPAYRRLLAERGRDASGWRVPPWDEDAALAMMDARGIAAGMLSVSTPGVHLGDDTEARELARQVNEYTAELVARRPRRFGHLASLPLPDIDGAVAAAGYALEELRADGVILFTNYGGRYLGDAAFEPLWRELGAREAVALVHPTASPFPPLDRAPYPVVDFLLETTRTAVDLVLAGVTHRYPELRFILAHVGGFLPYGAHRIAVMEALLDPGRGIDDLLADLRGFYFDTALSASPTSLPAVLAFAGAEHVLHGTDWPYVPADQGAYFDGHLDAYSRWSAADRDAADHGNARRLFPRLTRATA